MLHRCSARRVRRHPDAYRQFWLLRCSLEMLLNSRSDAPRRAVAGLRQQQGEFIAAVSRSSVDSAAMLSKDFRDAADGARARLVSITVIDFFQLVEIHQQDRKMAIGSPRSFQFALQQFDKAPVICQSRQAVADRSVADLSEEPHVINQRPSQQNHVAHAVQYLRGERWGIEQLSRLGCRKMTSRIDSS